MNPAHMHLLLNHFPLIGFFFGLIFLVLGHFLKNQEYGRSGLIILIFSGILAVPAFLTGEPAEKVIDKMPSFSEEVLSPHEEAAEIAIWFIGATSILAAGCLWMSVKKHSKLSLAMKVLVVLNLFTLVLIARTNNLGGKVSHLETREAGPTSPAQKADAAAVSKEEKSEKKSKENH